MLEGGFIEWIAIVHGVIRVIWSPFFSSNKRIIEDFFGIDSDESSVHVVRDSTTVVAVSDKTLNRWPWNRSVLNK
jgi:hypothetical protein